MEEKLICKHCNTEIDWEDIDDRKGVLWGCDICSEYFCEQCFIDKYGKELYDKMIANDDKVCCKDCYSN